MKILLASDKFKGSATAEEVCACLKAGLSDLLPEAEYVLCPLADGGDGTAEILAWHCGGVRRTVTVPDPLGRLITADYFLNSETGDAFMEMASASGLALLQPGEANPLLTSTVGVGEMMKDAVKNGASNIFLGIGGSATNDLALGAASVFGLRLLNSHGKELPPIGKHLADVRTIDRGSWNFSPEVNIRVICDVDNPLYGPKGAAHVYAEQKGASPEAIQILDQGIRNVSDILLREDGTDLQNLAGGGAAGGMGAGMQAFFGAGLVPGIDWIMEQVNLRKLIREADVVITGEGQLDEQTLHGKVVAGVARIAREHHVPVLAVTGALIADAKILDTLGLTFALSICPYPITLQEAMSQTDQLLKETGQRLGLLLKNRM